MKLPTLVAAFCCAGSALCQGYDPSNFDDLHWENVGPARGGRSIACSGVRKRPNEFYFGATGGGLWKTTDAGVTWNCVTDGFLGSSSVGAVAVSESNPDVVFIGTGERDIRGDLSEGDGIYKSVDGGKSWKRSGLENTRTISKILIDPRDPNIVYVAALGHVFGSGPDRGVYKSVNGGQTWVKVLFESDKAGAVDLQFDPSNSNVIYASTWDAWRTPFFLNSGGPGSKLFKSIDAGKTWTNLTGNPGLPASPIGKIRIAVSTPNPKRIWASVEAKDGGIFKSEDAGATWLKMTGNPNYTQRAWYFSHIFADPKDANTIYDLNVGAYKSTDAGKTWSSFSSTHSDNHDLWINPDDPSRMIEANDGGASVSVDKGRNWTRETYPTAEIYHVVADNHIPYRIYGAQQDNSSVRVSPSERNRPDHPNWEGTAGGEAGYIAVNAKNPDLVYGGNYSGYLEELDEDSGMSRDINAWPDNPMGHAAADLEHRFQWTFPIVFSPKDPNTLYTASQYLLRTRNRGASWERISPDLTRNEKSKQRSSGGPITQDNTSIEYYDTIFTVAESPVKAGVIWTGSDDGLVHVTRNDGKDWLDVTPSSLPKWARCSMIEASPHDPATAYLAANDYQDDDTAPYIYRTHDFGQSWTKIVTGIRSTAFARVCREDLHRAGLLYAGTETGAYVSFDDGDHWQPLQKDLPLCPVHDLCLKDDDLIAATHGRSFWIMHGVSRLSELTATKPSQPILYQPINRMRGQYSASFPVEYYLPAEAKKSVLTVADGKGHVLVTQEASTSVGIHSNTLNPGHPGFGGFPGMVLWSGFSRRIPAPPGDYTVTLEVDGKRQSKRIRLFKDPRVSASLGDLEEQYAFSVLVNDRVNEANQAVIRIRDAKTQIAKAVTDSKNDPQITASAQSLTDALTSVEGEIYQYRSHSGEDPLNYPVKLNDKLAGVIGTVQSGEAKPTRQAKQVFAKLSGELELQLVRLKGLETKDLTGFNALLKSKNLSPVAPKNEPLVPAAARRVRPDDDDDNEDLEKKRPIDLEGE